MKKTQLDIKKLFTYIENLHHIPDNWGTYSIHEYSQKPFSILIYNEIMNHSKEDLEDYSKMNPNEITYLHPEGISKFDIVFGMQDSYVCSAFLKQGIFIDKLTPSSKWLLNALDNPSDDIFQLIYHIENSIMNKKDKINDKNEDTLHSWILDSYITDINHTEQIDLLDKYLNEFSGKYSSDIIKHIIQKDNKSYSNQQGLIDEFIISKLQLLGVDINKDGGLNLCLPDANKDRFRISSNFFPQIEHLLDCGLKFDEKKYVYKGDNLFIATVKSENKSITDFMLPKLTSVIPPNGDWEAQNSYIDSLEKTHPNTYKSIQARYQALLLDGQLETKENNKNKPKVKL